MTFRKLVCLALLIKLLLFVFSWKVPQAKILFDSEVYLELGKNLAVDHRFARVNDQGFFVDELRRTPGYPFFLGLFHHTFGIPLIGIIFLQFLMSLATARVVYLTAKTIDSSLAKPAALFVLFDLPTSIHSQLILTEIPFMLAISVFLFFYIRLLMDKSWPQAICAGVFLAIAVYIRPIAIYLGLVSAIYLIWSMARHKMRKILFLACMFLISFHSLIGIWQLRNYAVSGKLIMTNIAEDDFGQYGLVHSYQRLDRRGPHDWPAPAYYANVVGRCFVSLMTRPGTLKYYNHDQLKALGKVYGYMWVSFWLLCLLAGIKKAVKNRYLKFAGLVLLYFSFASIYGAGWAVSSRFRVQMMPVIALLCAAGWQVIQNVWYSYRRISS